MRQVTGNLWASAEHGFADVVVITTNGFVKASGSCVMGRGCAREARDRYPGIDKRLGALIKAHGNRAFRLMRDPEFNFWIASMPTKHIWLDKSNIPLIQTSALQLMAMADKFTWQSIVMPRPGCGNGQLSWDAVEPAISPLLDDRFTVTTFE